MGNQDYMTVDGVTTDYTCNSLDQLISAGSVTYDYDDRGNQIKITDGVNITDYTYDAADRLSNVSASGVNAIYAYDADGRRIKQTIGSQITNYLWDEASVYGDVVYEYDGTGTSLASYVLGGTQLISQTRSGTTSYFLQDGQGSTRALTGSTGAVTDTYSYTAFGELFNSSGTTANNYLYTGQQFDSLTSLYSLRARYHNPALGRFLSQDTYPYNFGNPVELNRYVYVANDPVNKMDPSGHLAIEYQGLTLSNRGKVAVAVFIVGGTVLYWISQLIETLPSAADTFERIAQLHYQRINQPTPQTTVFPPPWPVTPSVSTPQPTETPEPAEKVLVVGDGNFSYTTSLSIMHSDWMIIGSTYGDGSNNQVVLGTNGNTTFVDNVDATRLSSGAITGVNRYDAVIFNNPYAGVNGELTASLISSFIRSARSRLTPAGEIHINVTKQLLLDFADVRAVLGVPSINSIDGLRIFGQTPYYAPYIPSYSDGNIMRYYGDDPTKVTILKNFVFR